MMGLVVGGATAQRFIGSVVDKQHSKSMGPHPPGVLTDNATIGTFPGKHDGDGSRLDSYIIILAIVSTIFPLICLILSLVIARRLWVKYRGERCATVEREDTAQTSLKSRDGGSRKSSRASRVTKDPNSRDQLIPQDSMITSPSEGPVEEEGEDHVEEIVVGDVEDENNEVASKVSVSMKNHSLVVEVEGAPNMQESPIITENGKTHHLTEAQVEPRVSTIAGDMLKTLQLPGAAGEIGINSLLQKGVITVYLKRSKSERVRPRNSGEEASHSVVGETVEHISPRPHHRRLSMGHHPRASHHSTPQRLTVEPENGNFGLSTSDVSLDSSSSCNPSYKYGNQVSYAGGYYGYPVSQGYPAADRHSRRMHLVVPRGSGGGEDTLGIQREKVDRKTSLPNSLDNQQQAPEPKPSSLSPSRSVSRGALSKQYSLPASARNTRYMPRHRHSFRHDRPQYQHHEHAFDHPHVRTHSASLHAPHDHRPHVSRELHSPRHESPHRPRELHSPRLESPHLPRELHSPRVETPVVASVVVDEPQDQPT
ncbi:uncharacterized protein LOC126987036 isoform X3 [Eriocheir sinensis]|uniref:uncharacterized protein LOC126987036 isoform X3 n=1 Tax=Eriocheir sinensis TaxID=95602 RepID=UPI0021CA75B7|nr:uncharacterized protein LOC126987036 isoform X3 [Eriocheir sinensis]